MARDLLITKPKTNLWISNLLENSAVVAPIKEETVLFKPIKDSTQIYWEFTNTTKSPKEFVLPQTQNMFKFQKAPHPQIEPEIQTTNQIILGIRPCDLQGILLLDKIFNGEYKDVYYLNTRANTTLMSIMCNEPHWSCFCPSMGVDLEDIQGADIVLTELDEVFYVEIKTDKGKNLVKPFMDYFEKPTQAHEKYKAKKIEELKDKFHRSVDLTGLAEKLDDFYESDYWAKLAQSCVGCALCTYLCPTCFCFDLQDELLGWEGVRFRCWDSCQFAEFTRMASGENPRPTKKERLRQRIYHKFKYLMDNYRGWGCVGCGRCVELCPVNIDIRKILTEIRGEKW